jgi:hypothetical protein
MKEVANREVHDRPSQYVLIPGNVPSRRIAKDGVGVIAICMDVFDAALLQGLNVHLVSPLQLS